LSDYLRLALSGAPTARPGERFEGLEAARETLFLNLRRARGADPVEFERRTGRSLQSMLPGLEKVIDARLLEIVPDGTVRLTPEGRFLADTVAGEVLVKAGRAD
jgi:coproporphyrinogen III oxidase-like Fe-S oxidoreductase